ncbi:MAG TPA: UPF0149 family protein, partial [Gemmatimonadales bacterium]|nr:UPF0149 family protein [Gemmatimonadales bacterium]
MAVSESDLDYLDKWLSSDESPPNSMMLTDLDGFLTAVAIGSEVIVPSEWLPVLARALVEVHGEAAIFQQFGEFPTQSDPE